MLKNSRDVINVLPDFLSATTVIIGIAVGSALVVLLFVTILLWRICKRRKRSSQSSDPQSAADQVVYHEFENSLGKSAKMIFLGFILTHFKV